MLAILLIVLQMTSLGLQFYCLYQAIRHGRYVCDVLKGYGIWGGAVTVLLGLPIQLHWV